VVEDVVVDLLLSRGGWEEEVERLGVGGRIHVAVDRFCGRSGRHSEAGAEEEEGESGGGQVAERS